MKSTNIIIPHPIQRIEYNPECNELYSEDTVIGLMKDGIYEKFIKVGSYGGRNLIWFECIIRYFNARLVTCYIKDKWYTANTKVVLNGALKNKYDSRLIYQISKMKITDKRPE